MKVYLVIQVYHGVFEDVDVFLDAHDAGRLYKDLKAQFKNDSDMEIIFREEEVT